MPDLFLEWQGDLWPDASGDLLIVDDDDETRQRLERRLFTAVKGYVWHQDYGAGLPQKIGDPWTVPQITTVVNAQVYNEASVAPYPPVQIIVAASPNQPDSIGIGIKYTHAETGVAVNFDIETLAT